MSALRNKNVALIWLSGYQNTGKKTLGELIRAKYGLEHISVSELLRSESENDTKRGRMIEDCLNNHKRINDVNIFFTILLSYL